MRPTVVIFAKDPRPGAVKTRLGNEIGVLPATWWYRRALTRLLRRLGRDPRWRTIIAVAPDAAVSSSLLARLAPRVGGRCPRPPLARRTPPRYLRRKEATGSKKGRYRQEAGERRLACSGQGDGDLGARMARVLAAVGPGPVLVVGSDIPGVDARAVSRAFAVLRGSDAVMGPAEDGGFWAIGLARGGRAVPGLFDGVRWSGPHAMADTLATLGDLRVAFADRFADVDRAADLGPRDIR